MLCTLLLALATTAPLFAQFSEPVLLSNSMLQTESVEFADLNGDGLVDLLVAAAGNDLLGWFENNGQGGFGPLKVLTKAADGAMLIRAADLDGDGDMDVVGGSATDGKVRVFENLGNAGGAATFGPAVELTNAVLELRDLDLVDVTGDGFLDILTASNHLNRVAVLINKGDGTFKNIKVLVAPNLGATGVAGGDLDGDGLVDVVASHKISGVINYFKNLGNGNFANGVDIGLGSFSNTDVAVLDYDNDGDLDVLNSGSGLRVFENQGGGSFVGGAFLSNTSLGRMRIVDLDFDADLDIAVASQFSSFSRILRNDGGGQFVSVINLLQSNSAHDLAFGDYDNDGLMDAVSAAAGEDFVRFFHHTAPEWSGFPEAKDLILTDDGARAVTIGDLNGDGLGDIVSGSFTDGNINLYLSAGAGTFAAAQALSTEENGVKRILIGDFNGDTRPDVASLRTTNARIQIAFGNGAGGFAAPASALQIPSLSEMDAGDFDGDGDLDFVVARQFQDKLEWYANNGNGGFSLGGSLSATFDAPVALHAVDLDADGQLDVIAAGDVVAGVRWFRNQGGGNFVAANLLGTNAAGSRGIKAGDLNGDGLLDVVFANRIFGDITVVLQTAPGVFGAPVIELTGVSNTTDFALADITLDGQLDLVVTSSFVNQVRLHVGLGDGTFAPAVVLDDNELDYSAVAVGDVDGDGDLDVAYTSQNGDSVNAMRNDMPFNDCNANGVADLAELLNGTATDLDGNGVLDECLAPPLYADGFAIDAATGGAQTFALDAGAAHAGELYIMVGSLSGTAPGTPLGSLVVPINVDTYTNLLLTTGVVPLAPKFGVLDGSGQATATLTLPPGIANAFVGQTAHHAFVAFGLDFTFASNAVPLTIE